MNIHDESLLIALSQNYFKILAYKDEYEVARLLTKSRAQAGKVFDGDLKLTFHMAPPLLSRTGPDGRPVKRRFGTMMERLFPLLARFSFLRGTAFDPFGRSEDRRLERDLIAQYEADMAEALANMTPERGPAVLALAELPMQIKGFGPVKQANAKKAAGQRAALLARLRTAPMAMRAAE